MVYTPTGRIKIYVVFQFILQSIALGLAFYLIPKFGLDGYMLTFIIEPALFIITSYFYLKKSLGFSFANSNIAVMLYLMMSSVVLFGISEWNEIAGYIFGVIMIVFTWFFMHKKERDIIINKVTEFLNKFRKNK
jgi:O-antigen/teichoic acid export membrane protein